MLLFAETTFSTIAGYAESLPEPLDVLVFGLVIASAAFVLRSMSAKASREDGENARREEGLI